jgi:SH3-like domain-containing protein
MKFCIAVKVFSLFLLCGFVPNTIPEQEFLSTKFFKVSARSSPTKSSQVSFVLLQKHEPVQVISTFDNWKKILDIEKDSGWIHISALSNKRFVIITSKEDKALYTKPSFESRILAKLKTGVKCRLLDVKDTWCKVKVQNYQGWITKTELWGI